jgi:biopolymer transport protein ExbD
MKVRKSTSSGGDKIELQMTPMIDIVFQLLTFFIFTLKIVTPEGDFNVTMPAGGSAPTTSIEDVELPIRIKLSADGEGNLTRITRLNDGGGSGQTFPDFESLKALIYERVKESGGPGSDGAKKLEVELDCDYGLKFEYTIAAISAVSGEKTGEDVEKWIERIKFTPPK